MRSQPWEKLWHGNRPWMNYIIQELSCRVVVDPCRFSTFFWKHKKHHFPPKKGGQRLYLTIWLHSLESEFVPHFMNHPAGKKCCQYYCIRHLLGSKGRVEKILLPGGVCRVPCRRLGYCPAKCCGFCSISSGTVATGTSEKRFEVHGTRCFGGKKSYPFLGIQADVGKFHQIYIFVELYLLGCSTMLGSWNVFSKD